MLDLSYLSANIFRTREHAKGQKEAKSINTEESQDAISII